MVENKKMLYIIFGITLAIIIIGIVIIALKKNAPKKNNIEYVKESGIEYSQKQLNNFDFKIVNMDKDIEQKIIDIKEYKIAMKEYIYKNGLIQATEARYVDSIEDNRKITIKFKLNNEKQTSLVSIINSNNTYEFLNY